MKTLWVVHAPGLTPRQVVRGDEAATLSDLIADGSFSSLSEPPDVGGLAQALGPDRVRVLTVPFVDMASFDRALSEACRRAGAEGASLAVVSETVLVSRPGVPVGPGRAVAAADVVGLLASLL